ncbi:MAG: hypothetical protein IKZ61_00390 [Prevotella sp.]|nr:hypothetical protein [Prevotella sp.]
MKKYLILLLLSCIALGASAQTKKKVTRQKAKVTQKARTPEQMVIGRHMLSLQWISWDYFGSCNITKEADGKLRCKGEQLSRENDDYLRIDGEITIVDAKHLIFNGTIASKIYHINGGKECLREGTFDFEATQNRKFWRLQQMENPCDPCTDYVDIYFK